MLKRDSDNRLILGALNRLASQIPFTKEVVATAWKRSGGRSECTRPDHDHGAKRCDKQLDWMQRGKKEEALGVPIELASAPSITFLIVRSSAVNVTRPYEPSLRVRNIGKQLD